MNFETLARFHPFRDLEPKTCAALFAAASDFRASLSEGTPVVPRFCFQSLGGRVDILTPILLPLTAASGMRSIRHLLPGAQPIDPLKRKLSLFSGWNPYNAAVRSDLSRPGVSILGNDSLFTGILISALNERVHDADKELLRAGISLLMSGCDVFVFDMQTGPGTSFPDYTRAVTAAQWLQSLCESLHTRCAVMIRELHRPPGLAFGDGLEIREAISALQGSAPFALLKLLLEYGSVVMGMTGICRNKVEARIRMKDILLSREASALFRDAVKDGGGDFESWSDPVRYFSSHSFFSVTVDRGGYLHGLNVPSISRVMEKLRGSRPEAGFMLLKSPGDYLKSGEPLFSVFGCPDDMASSIRQDLLLGTDLHSTPPPYHPLIRYRVK